MHLKAARKMMPPIILHIMQNNFVFLDDDYFVALCDCKGIDHYLREMLFHEYFPILALFFDAELWSVEFPRPHLWKSKLYISR